MRLVGKFCPIIVVLGNPSATVLFGSAPVRFHGAAGETLKSIPLPGDAKPVTYAVSNCVHIRSVTVGLAGDGGLWLRVLQEIGGRNSYAHDLYVKDGNLRGDFQREEAPTHA